MASATPPTRPLVVVGDIALQALERDLPDVGLLGADCMKYGVYQDWEHQNTGDHLDGGIAEDGNWKNCLYGDPNL